MFDWEIPPRANRTDTAPILWSTASKGRSIGCWRWRAKKIDLARLSIGALIEASPARWTRRSPAGWAPRSIHSSVAGAPGPGDARGERVRPGRDTTELLRACLVALRVPQAQEAADRSRPPPYWRVGDAIRRLQQWLGERPDGRPLTTFLPKIGDTEPDRTLRCRVAMASTLIAGLELARDGTVALDQDDAWLPIRVRPTDHREAGLRKAVSPV